MGGGASLPHKDALIILLRPDAIDEAELLNSFAFILSSPVTLFKELRALEERMICLLL